ncbi:hypothetical protein BDK51DRAFT_29281 [Blyttiomyces helicus]|uniref:Uncharacterized protein n=1 Tax=Blyttiomyces helicus TaxID=388810 RepID=A0A4P9WJS5_9FUNG|nr:hypothetical protein BDK51DRAFT_29281 [Blyttiomyces helicus]|eukprot:RKO93191.1 hypothetical protein BDK51DRAFT_29281 [Blyttiomyces helicus]
MDQAAANLQANFIAPPVGSPVGLGGTTNWGRGSERQEVSTKTGCTMPAGGGGAGRGWGLRLYNAEQIDTSQTMPDYTRSDDPGISVARFWVDMDKFSLTYTQIMDDTISVAQNEISAEAEWGISSRKALILPINSAWEKIAKSALERVSRKLPGSSKARTAGHVCVEAKARAVV